MPDDFHLYRKDRRLHWHEIAATVRENPGLLQVPLGNIERWLAKGRLHPAPLQEWKRRILLAQSSPEDFQQLLAFMEADNHDSEPLKSCSPFVGFDLVTS